MKPVAWLKELQAAQWDELAKAFRQLSAARGHPEPIKTAPRDFRREHWSAVYCTILALPEYSHDEAGLCADAGMLEFDKRFPS